MQRLIRIAAGLVCLVVCALIAANHPLGSKAALLSVLGYVAVLAVFPNAWLALIPALLPVAGLASWSGWLYLDEFDLVLLASLGMLLVRAPGGRISKLAAVSPAGPLDLVTRMLLGLLAISYAVALIRGLWPLPPLDANAFASYESRYNAMRIFKGFAAALAFWPFIAACLRENESRTLRLIGTGVASGLALACLAGLWERLAFPGLTDLASDYRITGSFWEMHTGGAAIDGFLALTVPFAVWASARSHRPWQHIAASLLLALTGYVVLVTFTRTTYIAICGGLCLVLLLRWRAGDGVQSTRWKPKLVWLSVVGIVASPIVLMEVFATGGYRGLGAVVGLWLVTFLAAPLLRDARPSDFLKGAIGAAALAPPFAFIVATVPKGPYWIYAVAFLAAILAVAVVRRARAVKWLLAASYALLALAVVPVAAYWGGRDAASGAALATGSAIVVALWHLRAREPLWVLDRPTLTAMSTLGIIFCIFVVASGSFRVSTRFGQVTEDLSVRINHWQESLSSLQTPRDWALGVGLGRFPDLYFWSNATSERPGAHRFIEMGGNTYLALSGPRYAAGYGEIYRFSQRVSIAPTGPLDVVLDVRTNQTSRLVLEVCEKHLLYRGACRTARIDVAPTGNDWKHLTVTLPEKLGNSPWYAPRLMFFIVANSQLGTLVEIDNVQLLGADVANYLSNGDFANGMDHWFFTSDHHHLAWHIKNVWLNLLFEQGVLGLTLFTAVLGLALFRITLGKCRKHPFAPYLAGSLVGFCVTGLFDTLVDVTRIAFLFYMLTFIAMLLPDPRRISVVEPLPKSGS